MSATIKSRLRCLGIGLSDNGMTSDDHKIAIEGWKARKDQLLKQRESVMVINDKAEKVNLVSFFKQKNS